MLEKSAILMTGVLQPNSDDGCWSPGQATRPKKFTSLCRKRETKGEKSGNIYRVLVWICSTWKDRLVTHWRTKFKTSKLPKRRSPITSRVFSSFVWKMILSRCFTTRVTGKRLQVTGVLPTELSELMKFWRWFPRAWLSDNLQWRMLQRNLGWFLYPDRHRWFRVSVGMQARSVGVW